MSREEWVNLYLNKARSYLGTPFKHQGRSKNGMDCIGIIIVPLNDIGFFNYENKNYRKYGLGGEIIEVLSKHCYEVKKPFKYQAGDILLFSKGSSQHLAIYTDKDTIIHAHNFVGKVVEHSLTKDWEQNISKVFRYKEE
jgi:cell wall-associated NlpC family hydrolase